MYAELHPPASNALTVLRQGGRKTTSCARFILMTAVLPYSCGGLMYIIKSLADGQLDYSESVARTGVYLFQLRGLYRSLRPGRWPGYHPACSGMKLSSEDWSLQEKPDRYTMRSEIMGNSGTREKSGFPPG